MKINYLYKNNLWKNFYNTIDFYVKINYNYVIINIFILLKLLNMRILNLKDIVTK